MCLERKKILIITRYFLPYFPSMGGIMRVFTLANYLNRMGLEVFILTAKGSYHGYFGYDNINTQIHIIYIGRSKGNVLRQFDGSHVKSKPEIILDILTKISHPFRSLLNKFCIPDENIFMINSFLDEAKSIISSNNIKNVFISSPPHSMQLVGYRLKKDLKTNINVITDYRDSWNTTSIFKHKTYLGNSLNKMYEKKVLLSCDKFTYVSEPILKKVEKLHKLDIKKKSMLIMNGYNNITKDNQSIVISNRTQKIKIGYFGSLNSGKKSYRNISNLIEILIENDYLAEKFDFYFYGSIQINHPEVSDLKGFHINAPLNHEKAIEKMREMDYLMIVHSDPASSDEVITGKFFEYISVRKPILCLAPPEMEGGRLVEMYNIGYHIDLCNKDSLKIGLTKLDKPDNEHFYADLDVGIFSRDIQYSKLLNLLI